MAKDTDRRFTPSWLIELVTDALGPIELDPCTEPDNPTGAARFLTEPDQGELADWGAPGLTWINPPFSAMRVWVERTINDHVASGREVVMLTSCDATTRWYASLTRHAALAAPLRKRLKFGFPVECEAPKSGADFACMLWYLGGRSKLFAAGFRDHAHLYMPGLFPSLGAP